MRATSIITQKHRPNSDKNQEQIMASYAEMSIVYDINRCTNHTVIYSVNNTTYISNQY